MYSRFEKFLHLGHLNFIEEKLNFNIGVDQTWLKEIRSNAIYRNFTEKLEILVAKGCKVHDIAIYDLDYYHISHMACFMQELLLG